ncbi:MAG: hypothetical protein MOGMAGMI_00340 [Candidatus Omnitrophica bacterium]|nr:hypothetical protein [Candidatus Omnitrophota bacterium]
MKEGPKKAPFLFPFFKFSNIIKVMECLICRKVLTNKRAKICSDKSCKSKWKLERIKNYPDTNKQCLNCSKSFPTKDSRNNFCSYKCKSESSIKRKLEKYGKKSITSSNPERVEKIRKTLTEKYSGSFRRQKWLSNRGLTSFEDLNKSIGDFCREHNLAPNSPQCLEHFKMSTFMNRELSEHGQGDILYNQNKISSLEKEILTFLQEISNLEIIRNYRPEFLEGREIDIYLPSHKVGIELHGLVFHSERPIFGEKDLTKIKTQHQRKFLKCRENGVTLLQFFEDEVLYKKEIVFSIILNKLGISTLKLNARDCEIREVSLQESKIFLEENHLAGYTTSSLRIGLHHPEKGLVSLLTFRRPFNKKYGNETMEIARFVSLKNTLVRGGFSKLLKQAEKILLDLNYTKILTYADCRISKGEVYSKNYFQYLSSTQPNYFYEKSGARESRQKHRKKSGLELTEKQQNNQEGWFAIYDAGSLIFEKSLLEEKLTL